MPYAGERANKSSHRDIIGSREAQAFFADATTQIQPSKEATVQIAQHFMPAPVRGSLDTLESVIAIDGSVFEPSLEDELPSTRIGFVKIAAVRVFTAKYAGLVQDGLADPFAVAKLREDTDAICSVLPSANVTWKGSSSVREGFRARVHHELVTSMLMTSGVPESSLLGTGIMLLKRAAGRPLNSGVILPRCPNEYERGCTHTNIELTSVGASMVCPHCNGPIWISDAFRIWEEVGEFQPNGSAMTRYMNLVEHLIPIHFIRTLVEGGALQTLADSAFLLDGPLALFGTVAKIHQGIHSYLMEVNMVLERADLSPLLYMGLVKTGTVADHATLMSRFTPRDRILLVDENYRYRYVQSGTRPANGFGAETYYGQDFIFRTRSGRTFVLNLPIPQGGKTAGKTGLSVREDIARYPTLPRALALIEEFESDLYQNALVPIALAHRHTAISIKPGGNILKQLLKKVVNP